jgi:septal ring factor EnvC (AmiA/AmiB activator)
MDDDALIIAACKEAAAAFRLGPVAFRDNRYALRLDQAARRLSELREDVREGWKKATDYQQKASELRDLLDRVYESRAMHQRMCEAAEAREAKLLTVLRDVYDDVCETYDPPGDPRHTFEEWLAIRTEVAAPQQEQT